MNKRSGGQRTVLWWIGWIALTIASFFLSCLFWTRHIAAHVGPMSQAGVPVLWVSAVFGTWMLLLVPLIVVMYNKVDKAYEDSRIARETTALQKARAELGVRAIRLDEKDRRLAREITDKLKKAPETIRHGHLVTAKLRDGRSIENVFIRDKKEMLGIYGVPSLSFTASEIVDVEPAGEGPLPDFKPELWLRLDGIGDRLS